MYKRRYWTFPERANVHSLARALLKPDLIMVAKSVGIPVSSGELKGPILEKLLDYIANVDSVTDVQELRAEIRAVMEARHSSLHGDIATMETDYYDGHVSPVYRHRAMPLTPPGSLSGSGLGLGSGSGSGSGSTAASSCVWCGDLLAHLRSTARCTTCREWYHPFCRNANKRLALQPTPSADACFMCILRSKASAALGPLWSAGEMARFHHANHAFLTSHGPLSNVLARRIRIPSEITGRVFVAVFDNHFQPLRAASAAPPASGSEVTLQINSGAIPLQRGDIMTHIPEPRISKIHASTFRGRSLELFIRAPPSHSSDFFVCVVAERDIGRHEDPSLPARIARACATGSVAEHQKKIFDVMDDQMVVKETIPLSCPLSMAFLKNPCRGKSCTHLSCYEFEDLCQVFNLVWGNDKFTCPICNRPTQLSEVVVDKFIQDVIRKIELQKYSDGDFSLDLHADGRKWFISESGAVPAFRLKQQYSQAPAPQSSPATAITALTAGVSPAASLTPLDKDAPCGGVGLSTKPSPDGVAGAGLDAPDVNPTKRGRLSDDGGDSEHESLPNIDPFAALDPLSLWGGIEPGDSADAPIELF